MEGHQRWLWISATLLAWLSVVAIAPAVDLKLKDGTIHRDVQILERTSQAVEIKVAYGIITVPLSAIESIDGVALAAPSPSTRSDLMPTDSIQLAAPEVTDAAQVYVHDWRMEWLLLAMALVMAIWVSTLLWVQKDARGTPAQIKRANVDALLLPGLGLVIYLISRTRRHHKREEVRSLAGRVAGLQPAEAPKQRGLFGGRARFFAAFRSKKGRLGLEFLDVDRNPIQIKKDLPEMTGIEAAREVLEDAIEERASDVHLEPHENGCRVRFRIDGALQERMTFEKADGVRVVSALKTLAQIDVAEKRKAQDGRFRVRTAKGEIDFRAATASSIHGEKVVLRILDRKSGLLSLSELGMPAQMMERFDRVIHSRNGMILVTGPTGAGKTSTLYAALSRLDQKRLNIMSIEDPVEYELDGATQIPVNPRAGVTYDVGLRSIMRQDPDVIFVGEMRDAEAAKIAIRAALTGHLVFSSLHTKNAIGTVVRLEEIGVEKYQISSALLIIVAQRLVRVLCKECRKPDTTSESELSDLGIALQAGQVVYRSAGCSKCDHTGYQGRTGIFELLVLDEDLRKVINEGANEQIMTELAIRKGFRTYREDGVDKVLSGITTVEEVLHAS